jgi:hypothetical protein
MEKENKITFMWDLKNIDKYYKIFEKMGLDGRIDLLLKYKADKHYRRQPTMKQKIILDFWFGNVSHQLAHLKDELYTKSLLEKTMDVMVSEGLITYTRDSFKSSYELTIEPKGTIINSNGGWKYHIWKKKIMVITPLFFGLIGVVVGMIGIYISYSQYNIKKTETLRYRQVDSTIHSLQLNINQLNHKIQQDSTLLNRLDSDLTTLKKNQ